MTANPEVADKAAGAMMVGAPAAFAALKHERCNLVEIVIVELARAGVLYDNANSKRLIRCRRLRWEDATDREILPVKSRGMAEAQEADRIIDWTCASLEANVNVKRRVRLGRPESRLASDKDGLTGAHHDGECRSDKRERGGPAGD
jgi:hypothetical protein